jgi:hypothetical protein
MYDSHYKSTDNGFEGSPLLQALAAMFDATPDTPRVIAEERLPPVPETVRAKAPIEQVPRTVLVSPADQSAYVQRAVHNGRVGANIVGRLMKAVMGADMAQDYADKLIGDFFWEYAPTTQQERMLVEHVGVVHAQLLLVRAKWSGASRTADIESLTRVETRLSNELLKLLDALVGLRQGRRMVIAHANIGTYSLRHVVTGVQKSAMVGPQEENTHGYSSPPQVHQRREGCVRYRNRQPLSQRWATVGCDCQ